MISNKKTQYKTHYKRRKHSKTCLVDYLDLQVSKTHYKNIKQH